MVIGVKRLALVACLLWICPGVADRALGQEIVIDLFNDVTLLNLQSFNTALGVGARALGMGGAFIAVADDATAASWNPAGLAFLIRPEVSVVGDRVTSRFNTRFFGGTPQARVDGSNDGSGQGISFVSVAYPVEVGSRPTTLQLSYHRQIRLLKASAETSFIADVNFLGRTQRLSGNGKQQRDAGGGFDTLSLGGATTISPQFLVGVTLNYWFGSADSVDRLSARIDSLQQAERPVLVEDSLTTVRRVLTVSGLSANVGLLYRPTKWLSVGGVYRSGWVGNASSSFSQRMTGVGTFEYQLPDSTRTETRLEGLDVALDSRAGSGSLSWPAAYGLGIAVRPVSTLTITADFTRQDWSHGSVDLADATKTCTNDGVTMRCRTEKEILAHRLFPTQPSEPFIQNNQNAFRFGVEYVFFAGSFTLPVRVGAYRIDSIAPYFGGLSTKPVLAGYTFGASIGRGGLFLDGALVQDTSPDARSARGGVEATRDVRNTRVLTGLTYRF